MSKRYCIAGAWYSSPNIGDQAILATILHLVRREDPGAHFTVFSSRPDFVKERHDVESYHIKRKPWRVLGALAKADVYIIGGGTPFYASLSNLTNYLITALAARLFRRKVMVYAVSTRDLYTWWSRLMAGWIFKLADRVTIREKATLDYVNELFPKLGAEFTSDPAIVTNELACGKGADLLREAGLPKTEAPLFGFSCRNFDTGRGFNIHHYEQYTAKQIETYWTALAKAADVFAGHGLVVFFPMNTVAPDDDRVSAENVRARMEHPDKAFIIRRQFAPGEAAAVMGAFKCMVASRLHATIISASQYVPSIGLSYGHKTAGFLGALLPARCILGVESLGEDDVAEAARFLLDGYEDIVAAFRKKVDASKRLALENAEALRGLA